jgi:hypothetical protein
MSNLILYAIDYPLFKCIECEEFVLSDEHDCDRADFICSDERLEDIKQTERAKQNGSE